MIGAQRADSRRRPMKGTLLLLAGLIGSVPTIAIAELTRLEITHREPWAGGREFGASGAYERMRGRAWFEVGPGAKANRTVVDLELAPKNKAGRVEFSADVEIIAPVDLSKSCGAIFYDVNNRGNPTCLGTISAGGEHFLMREGFILVFSGWIAEPLPSGRNLVLDAPIARVDGVHRLRGGPVHGIVDGSAVSLSGLRDWPIPGHYWVDELYQLCARSVLWCDWSRGMY